MALFSENTHKRAFIELNGKVLRTITIQGMATAAFDTFQAARALESAGVERGQAEAIAEAIQQRHDYATKSDVARLGSELRSEIGELRGELRSEIGELRADMAALETRLMNRIYAIAIGQAGLIAAFGLFIV